MAFVPPRRSRVCGASLAGSLIALLLTTTAIQLAAPVHAWALSEIKREELPAPPGTVQTPKDAAPVSPSVPLPDPIKTTPPQTEQPATPDQAVPDDAEPDEGTTEDGVARPDVDPNAPLPEIFYDVEKLPEPVRRMRQLIIEACKNGEIEGLRPLIGGGADGTQLSLGGTEGDPVAFLKDLSGDKDGQEILAILEEVLNAGYVHMDAGKPEELYVWPYFFAVPLDRLNNKQRVELFKIVTAGDYEDMKTYGTYIFYRVGITPDGRWQFFVAGD